MAKFTAFLLSLLITLYSGALNSAETVQSVLDSTGVPYALAARGAAKLVRLIEQETQKQPAEGEYRKKTVLDNTKGELVTDENEMITAEWLMNEIVLTSGREYTDPFNDVDVSLVLAGNGVKYTVPGFWDGGSTWRVRFVCPSEGTWYYKTVCTDGGNAGLDGIRGKVVCREYSGDKEIYRHGFVTTSYGKKYITYDDGTPFFYLGDTHWSLGDETVDMVKAITEKRAGQGFTVIQSEPIGAKFDFTDGIKQNDMPGFADYDAKFRAIADAGLVHANAEFFYPVYMHTLIERSGGYTADGYLSDGAKAYLEKAARYWVARYGAFPVMWTLGQEVDNDFYSSGNSVVSWNSDNNPYKLLAKYMDKYDAYSHPLSAHQENCGSTAAYGNGENTGEKLKAYNKASPSAFRNVKAHSWYAAQWSPSLTKRSDCRVEKDYWYNSQGKPAVNYEGRYCGLWTKNFGSRMQGWASYLSGMFGYGWGAHDTWSYLNIYDEENDSSDGVDTITSAEKINATWEDALEYPCSYQVGYMKRFFTSFDWWNLIPRFNNALYFTPDAGVMYYAASNAGNSRMVLYFYSFSDESIAQKPNANIFAGSMTGTVGSLEPSTEYRYKWFNPSTGEYSAEGSFVSTPFGTYTIGQRSFNGQSMSCDMVFYMYK
ncbi:MAG: DUF4038 domain-containing protein [Clostridia bacterium]|nr:DUF4038 domain-containing protein [Clostridia bacterium]